MFAKARVVGTEDGSSPSGALPVCSALLSLGGSDHPLTDYRSAVEPVLVGRKPAGMERRQEATRRRPPKGVADPNTLGTLLLLRGPCSVLYEGKE